MAVEATRGGFDPAEVEASFASALATGSGIERDLLLAGRHVRVRLVGSTIAEQLTRPLRHLGEPPEGSVPELTIGAWDSATTGAPEPPLAERSGGPVRARLLLDRPGLRAVYVPAEGTFSVLDEERSLGWYWTRDARLLPEWELAAPFRYLLSWWFGDHGGRVIHSGAVGDRDGMVLVIGPSGSGKSTTSLVCLADEFTYAGDDHALVTDGDRLMVHGLYSTAKLTPEHLRRLPALQPWAEYEPGTEKALIPVADHAPEKLISALPVDAIALPNVAHKERTEVSPSSAVAALAALAPSTVFLLPGREQQTVADLARLIRGIPVFRFDLGPVETIPAAMRELLARARSG